MNIGKLHVLVLHFPVALVYSGLLAEVLYVTLKKDVLRSAARYCVVLGGVSSVVVVITGLAAAGSQAFAGDYAQIVSTHKWLGIGAMTAGVLAAAAAVVYSLKPTKTWAGSYYTLLGLFTIFTGLAAHYGGMLVQGKNYLSELF